MRAQTSERKVEVNKIYPAFAMMALTVIVMLRMVVSRFAAVKSGKIDPKFFRLYRDYEEPAELAVQTRHVVNHFETPVIFYVLCLFATITGQTGTIVASLAWAYVACRCIHSYVHLSSNNVMNRLRVFALSIAMLIGLWGTILVGILR